jgi:hypothetical protein
MLPIALSDLLHDLHFELLGVHVDLISYDFFLLKIEISLKRLHPFFLQRGCTVAQ